MSLPKLREDGIPRRCDISLNTPAEKAIRAAVDEVEKIGASETLTDIVNRLTEIREKLADWLEKPQ